MNKTFQYTLISFTKWKSHKKYNDLFALKKTIEITCESLGVGKLYG